MYYLYGKINRGQVSRPLYGGCPLSEGPLLEVLKGTYWITTTSEGANFDFHIRKHYTFYFICVAKILYNSSMAFASYYYQLAPAFYMASYANIFTSLYTMTLLIVRSRIVHLTPFLGSSYHLHSHFLSPWGVVMLDTYKKIQVHNNCSSFQLKNCQNHW